MYDRQAMIDLLRERALRFGEFTLVSGQKSSYYLDGKQITLHSTGLRMVCKGLLEMLEGVPFDAIGGMSIGADPIIGGVLAIAAEQGRSQPAEETRQHPALASAPNLQRTSQSVAPMIGAPPYHASGGGGTRCRHCFLARAAYGGRRLR